MEFLEPVLRASVVVLAVIVLARLNGLRSFSKMSSFDFALTVAMGSIIATAIVNTEMDIRYGLVSLAAVFAIQAIIALARSTSDRVQSLTDNEPLLLMENGRILHHNLKASKVTEDDLYGKLREANALKVNHVHAVVLETTGDISVLHGAMGEDEFDTAILKGVRRGKAAAVPSGH